MTKVMTLPDDEEFNAMLEELVEFSASRIGAEGGVTPTLVTHEFTVDDDDDLMSEENHHLLYGFLPEKKHEVMFTIGEMMALEFRMVRAMFFVSEAWMVQAPYTGNLEADIANAKAQTRTHVLHVSGMVADGRANAASIMIEHDEEDKEIAGAIHWMRYGNSPSGILDAGCCDTFFKGYRQGVEQKMTPHPGRADAKGARWN